jgi:hypothetical protein
MKQIYCMVRLTLGVELGALVKDTETGGTRASTDEVGEGATQHARVDVSGVTGVGGLVAARELSLVTTLGLGLLDSQAVGNGEARSIAVLVLETISHVLGGHGSGEAGEGEDNGGESELHLERRVLKD